VLLDGSASADTNTPPLQLSFLWVQASGPAVALQDSELSKPFFTAPPIPQGASSVVLTFQLVVSNGFSSSAVATTTVTVSGPQAPIVNAGANQSVDGGSQVHLSASVTDPNGAAAQPIKYQWSQTSGPAVTLDNPASASPSFVAPVLPAGQAASTLAFRLTATDALGLSASGTTSVTVKPSPDTVTIVSATYKTAGSKLSVTARSSVTNGVPVLTLHVAGKPDVVMTYDPTAQTYSVPQFVVNPIPGSVTVTSSFGGSATSILTKIT